VHRALQAEHEWVCRVLRYAPACLELCVRSLGFWPIGLCVRIKG
jgi:hypothetical protein